MRLLIELAEEVGHLDRRQRRLPTGVPCLAARSLQGLLDRIGREHAEGDVGVGTGGNVG